MAVKEGDFHYLLDALQFLPDYQFLLRCWCPASSVSHHLMTPFLFQNHSVARIVMVAKLTVKVVVKVFVDRVVTLVVKPVVTIDANLKLGLVEVEMEDRF